MREIQPERVQHLNSKSIQKNRYVLYWMQASQRAECNHALEYAIQQANKLKQPLVALFGITARFPEANLRHYAFMLEGLKETRETLRKRGVQLVVRVQSPETAALSLAEDASLLVTDRGYLRIQKKWRKALARKAKCLVTQVESDVVVPVEAASQKEEYAAAFLRTKIHKQLEQFLVPLGKSRLRLDSLGMRLGSESLADLGALLAPLKISRKVLPVENFKGGTSRAKKLLSAFISKKLGEYGEKRNDPSLANQSHMSPYLHFGQISPLYVALQIQKASGKSRKTKDAYLEELVVRRELSMNFVHYNPEYDSYNCLPEWARKTLKKHRRDLREYCYTEKDLEKGKTHDPYWNTAQMEMVVTGKMHNYMRMYWGKKILEWTRDPQDAFRIALSLNNKYELDGRDPNAYAGVAWCFGKHDRPWGERKIFGMVRFMNDAGLRRKFDMDGYVKKVSEKKVSGTFSGRKGS